MRLRRAALLPYVLAASAGCSAPPAPETPMFGLNVGSAEVFDKSRTARYGIELRFPGLGRWRIAPTIGLSAGEDDSAFLHGDLRRDFWLGRHLALSPRAGLGAFRGGEQVDLGDTLEFRTGAELELRFGNGHRLGVGFFHLSNAGISDRNPGTEVVTITYSIPIPWRSAGRAPGAGGSLMAGR